MIIKSNGLLIIILRYKYLQGIDSNTSISPKTKETANFIREIMTTVSKKSNNSYKANQTIIEKIEIVNNIAFQTNILALNTAIETARAC